MLAPIAPIARLSARRAFLRPVVVSPAAGLARSASLRQISTVKSSDSQEQEILVAQRKNRPLSEDLTIYAPQLTWLMSGYHRITGLALGSGFYAITCFYAASSLLGYHADSSMLLSYAADMPYYVDWILKSCIAYPFAFHFNNGVRHLVWDSCKQTTLKGVYNTGYITLACTFLMGTACVLIGYI